MSSRVLIAGCGFVGRATARLFHREGWTVIACTHSAESAAALSGEPYRALACDISDRSSLEVLAEYRGIETVIHCASSGRGGADQYRRVYLDGAQHLAAVLKPRLLIFTSSTSVYAQNGGEWVTEESAAEPDRETGRILRETEEFVCGSGGIAARLAGIYGPGRSVLLKKFFSGEAMIEGDGRRSINQVHRDDIATGLFRLARCKERGVFNITDNLPIPQGDLYAWLAERFRRPLPPSGPVDPNRKRGWTDKRVSNARLRALGWEPEYPSFFAAIERDPELLAGLG